MKLLRLATIYLGAPLRQWSCWQMRFGAVTVTTLSLGKVPAPPQGRERLVLKADIPLARLPDKSETGAVAIPHDPRRECEAAIEGAAAVAAAYLCVERQISSPIPEIALEPESRQDEAFLSDAHSLQCRPTARQIVREIISPDSVAVSDLGDRIEGVGFYADALAQTDPLASYRELMRFFELAFALPASALMNKLYQFLSTGPGRYTRSEIDDWFNLRHAAIHGDGRKTQYLVVQADIRPILGRMLQAARDVVFNKKHWHTRSRERRSVWRPIALSIDRDGTVEIEQFSTPIMHFQLMDSFGAYPIDLSASLSPLPVTWWSPRISQDPPVFEANVVEPRSDPSTGADNAN